MNERSPSFDDLPCAVAIVDDEGLLLDVNTSLAQWLGGEVAHWRGQPVAALFPHAGSLLYQTYVFPLLKMGRQVDEVSIMLKHLHGERIAVLLSASRAVESGVGQVRCVFMRIHERRRMEEQLLTAKRVADQSPSMLFQLRRPASGPEVFSYVTDAVRPLFGVLSSQALQSAPLVWQCVHPDDRSVLQEALNESAQGFQPWRCEFRVCLEGQAQWREVHAVPTRDADGGLSWSGVMSDITERKQMEVSLRDKAAAMQANRAKSEFLSRMSHELRTPLNGILGFARLLQLNDAGNLRVDQINKLGYVETAGKSLLRLINEVLEISRIEAGHTPMVMGVVALDQVVEVSRQMAVPLAESRGVQWVQEGPTGLHVQADPDRLGQVLLNLISNAIKYGPSGGCVCLRVRCDAPTVHIDVVDQGPGLSQAQQAQLFQPFNRLGAEHGATEGVGLGLVITKGLVQLMGGELSVRSTPGQGACFTVSLPWAAEPPQPPGLAEAAVDALNGVVAGEPAAKWRVLYAEDNPINALLMEAVLELEPDFVLEVVGSGEQARQSVQRAPPDVLLLDMHLPDMQGHALLSLLHQEVGLADVPAVAVSASAMADDIALARDAGFIDYWTKPLDVARVAPALRALLVAQVATGGTMTV